MRTSIDLVELRARTPLVPLIGSRVKLSRSGREWKGCCPFHGEKTPSFYVYDDHFHCFGCGAHGDVVHFVMKSKGLDFHKGAKALATEAGMDGKPKTSAEPASPEPQSPEPASRSDDDTARRIERAVRLWRESIAAAATPVEAYLRSRGVALLRDAPLRFHPSCPRSDGDRLPAMIGAMMDPATNEQTGIHRTYLRADGGGKAAISRPKQMLGRKGVIRLAANEDVTTGLGLCEGIETALAIMQLMGWQPVWAAGDAGALKAFPVIAGLGALTLFADADDSGVGMAAARACAVRWIAADREATICRPPHGNDWLDALTGRETR